MADEKPVIEQPEAKPETEAKVDIEGLVNELQAAGISDPEKLKGHLTNARDYGRMQSERDRLAQELQAIRSEFAELRSVAQKPQRDEYGEEKPIDIEDVVARAFRRERQKELEQQRVAQQQIAKVWNKISTNEDFGLVREEFEGALRDPVTQFKLQTGEVDAVELFHGMVNRKYKDLAKRSYEALKTFKDAGTVPPPHIESGARVGTQQPDKRTDKQKRIDELTKKGKRPGGAADGDLDELLALTLGDL